MVEAALAFLRMVESKTVTRLLAVPLVLAATIMAAQHNHLDHPDHDEPEHHHDHVHHHDHDEETPVHAAGDCILCTWLGTGDGDLDAILPDQVAVRRLLDVNGQDQVTVNVDSDRHASFVRVRGPPIRP